jgi:hypothetical protein
VCFFCGILFFLGSFNYYVRMFAFDFLWSLGLFFLLATARYLERSCDGGLGDWVIG